MKFSIQKIILILVLIIGYNQLIIAQTKLRNSILFYAIDDRIEVYVDGELVFEKLASAGNLVNEVEFDLNPHVSDKIDPIVEIRLINSTCTTCESGNGWLVEFEIFQEGNSVDYIIEEGDSLGGDTVYTISYEWGYI
ncbi:MAG: hypothetical protein ABJH98_09025 [Reichenbachiella sp.]|uniref:hypothetical protein n=1 Tax=Reichenbachiella sp. TaxID=2184521 RepID=UPI00329A6197